MALSKIEGNSLDIGQIGGRRNLIINGAMQVAQRGASAVTNPNVYRIDRWKSQNYSSLAPSYTVEQSSDGPEGFSSSILHTCTSNTALGNNNYIHPAYRFEAQDIKHTGVWSSSSNNELTLSFYVKANYTGKHWVSFAIANSSVGQAATLHSSYTINSANTWERKSITIPAYSGQTTYPADTEGGLILAFTIAASSDRYLTQAEGVWTTNELRTAISSADAKNFCDTVGNTFQVTGVQLEVGSVATPFEHRSYGEELVLCKRYCQIFPARSGGTPFMVAFRSASTCYVNAALPFPMRALPTGTDPSTGTSTCANANLWDHNGSNISSSQGNGSTPTLSSSGLPESVHITMNYGSASGTPQTASFNGGNPGIVWDAEL